MRHSDGTFPAPCGPDIYYQSWLPDAAVKAGLLIVHGLGEHSGRYMNVVNHLLPLGFAVYAYDHIGHGQSQGTREYVDRYADIDHTLARFHGMVKAWQPGVPLFLLGHSMGGLIAAYYLLEHRDGLRGAVISAPTVIVGENITPAMIFMGKLLSVLAPKAGVLPLDPNQVSRDPEVVQAYINDPLVFHGKTPARLGAELLKAMQRVSAQAGEIDLPVLVIQGGEDRIVKAEGAQILHAKIGSIDKTVKIYAGLAHEVFNEPERALVLGDVAAWLEAHL